MSIHKVININAETERKKQAIEQLKLNTKVPSLEGIESILSYISTEVPEPVRDMFMIKDMIKKTHEMASMLDIPQNDIKELFDKYGIVAPIFEEQ